MSDVTHPQNEDRVHSQCRRVQHPPSSVRDRAVSNLHSVADPRSYTAVEASKRLSDQIASEGGMGREEQEASGGGHEGEHVDVREEGFEGGVNWKP